MKELRNNTIKWLCQCLGLLQQQVKKLETENAFLKDQLREVNKQNRTAKALSAVNGK